MPSQTRKSLKIDKDWTVLCLKPDFVLCAFTRFKNRFLAESSIDVSWSSVHLVPIERSP